ncbi:helix-turn-helix domain-containing protein [Sphingomonas ginsenosidimutans]|nr:hypothetical protein [Sphingomonas ginsenosidimutans]
MMTPGEYLRRRRLSEHLTVEDVAGRIHSWPRLGLDERANWIRQIEADVVPATFGTIAAIGHIVPIDAQALAALDAIRLGIGERVPQLCAHCAITPWQVIPSHALWSRPDLCPVCEKHGPPPGTEVTW